MRTTCAAPNRASRQSWWRLLDGWRAASTRPRTRSQGNERGDKIGGGPPRAPKRRRRCRRDSVGSAAPPTPATASGTRRSAPPEMEAARTAAARPLGKSKGLGSTPSDLTKTMPRSDTTSEASRPSRPPPWETLSDTREVSHTQVAPTANWNAAEAQQLLSGRAHVLRFSRGGSRTTPSTPAGGNQPRNWQQRRARCCQGGPRRHA